MPPRRERKVNKVKYTKQKHGSCVMKPLIILYSSSFFVSFILISSSRSEVKVRFVVEVVNIFVYIIKVTINVDTSHVVKLKEDGLMQ